MIRHLADPSYWHIPEWIDPASIDSNWSPDPASPPYIYEFPVEWGWDRVGGPQYRVPGATDIKYVNDFVARTCHNPMVWYQHCAVEWPDELHRWRPDPTDPPYDYVFGNQWYSAEIMPTVEYRMPGAVGKKYMDLPACLPKQHSNHWHTLYDCEWDYSWVPDPGEPAYIYVWGNQWWSAEIMPTVEYHVLGATERKYMTWPAHLCSNRANWEVPNNINISSIDFSWHPDPGDPAYIYEFATQWQSTGGARYVVPGATDIKYVNIQHQRLSDRTNWQVPENIDISSVDFSWHPDATESAYIYEFATQWQPTGGARYVVPRATDVKYVNIQHRRLSDRSNWQVPSEIDVATVDFSWHPDATEQPYIYEFATQWQPTGGARYVVPGATDVKYVNIQHSRLPSPDNWHIPHTVDPESVDFSWHPAATESAYVYEFATQWQPNGGAVYTVPGATERKYIEIQHRRLSDRANWHIPDTVDINSVDFSWHPDATESPYIYEFATQWQPNGGAVYTVPGAIERKYVEIQHRRLPDKTAWKLLEAVAKFDYSWHPDNTEPAYNYVFGNQHWPATEMPTIVYKMPGATSDKFMDVLVARLWGCMGNWEICEDIDDAAWDWSWVPNPNDPPYTYVFGNQWNPPELQASLKYHVEGATEFKYMDRRTRRLPQPELFRHNLAVADFDYSWCPDPTDPPMTYVWGNQWNPAVLEPTVVYSTGGTEIKYMDHPVATLAQDTKAWELLDDIESFDYSWRPNPTDPPYTYVFGNQWLTPEQRPALQYCVDGATEIKYMDYPRAHRRKNPGKFVQVHSCDFDWSWEPEPGAPPYIYVFGNQWHASEIMPTVTYTVPGATERKYMDAPRAVLPQNPNRPWYNVVPDCDWDYSWVPDPGEPPYIYVFGNQHWPAEKMPTIEYRVTGATERKYMDFPCAELLVNMTNWYVPAHVNVTDMDFSWVPDPGESPYVYQFATQHQKTGGPQYRVPGATEFKYVDIMRSEVKREAAPIFEIDHLDGNAGQIENTVRRVRYFDNYRDTLIRLAKSLVGQHEHVWVCSSICDYSGFDFSWHPERWQSSMLHVFASNEQKFGDTFYMHVPTFAERAEKKQLLEWYSVNYVPRKIVPRRPMPVIEHTADSHVGAVQTESWPGPLALFTTNGMPITVPAVNLWRSETRAIVPLSTGASAVVVPRSAVASVRTQLYDYPVIDKSQRKRHSDQVLDIVFISNGEPNARSNYLQMSVYLANESRYTNRVHVIEGINGRVAAYHAAARASTTPWFFAVFAKLEVNQMFDWTWQPDRMQQPKHYIFHAINPVNGLQYGHQAMIAYNQELVLNNPGLGLDFTLDSAHEVVPINSGTAQYNVTPWMTWRTAFREVIKLCSSADVESQYRLKQWLATPRTNVENWAWSVWGAEDAVEYYQAVKGDPTELRKSYEWDWLASYAFVKRSLTPDQ